MDVRNAANSPFVPGSDHVPAVWAGREIELADFHTVVVPRRMAGVYERGRMVLGEPGIGKSVLVNRIAGEAASAGHWVVDAVRVTAGSNAVLDTMRALTTCIQRHGWGADTGDSLLDRVQSVTLPVIGGGVTLSRARDDIPTHADLTQLLSALCRSAMETDPTRMVLIRIDEVQQLSGPGLTQLLTALADVLGEERVVRDPAGSTHQSLLPLAVYLSGLPSFVQRVTDAGATFARRFKIHELEALPEESMQLALRPFVAEGWQVLTDDGPVGIRMEAGAISDIITGSHGSPFLFQLLGDAAWVSGTGPLITAEHARIGRIGVRREVQRYVDLRLAGLSDLQRAYLQAAADLPSDGRTASAVAKQLGRTSEELGSTARALENRHRLIRRQAGRVVFTSPGLQQHLRGEL